MLFYLIPIALLLASLIIAWVFVGRGRPILGFALGIVPILVYWLYWSLRAEWALYVCRNDVTAMCELTGVGILLITALALLLIAFSAAAVAVMHLVRLYRQGGNLLEPANRAANPSPAWLLLLGIVVLAVTGLVAGYWLAGVVGASTAFWLTPFLAVIAATASMVVHERRTARD